MKQSAPNNQGASLPGNDPLVSCFFSSCFESKLQNFKTEDLKFTPRRPAAPRGNKSVAGGETLSLLTDYYRRYLVPSIMIPTDLSQTGALYLRLSCRINQELTLNSFGLVGVTCTVPCTVAYYFSLAFKSLFYVLRSCLVAMYDSSW